VDFFTKTKVGTAQIWPLNSIFLACRQFNLLGVVNPGEKIPRRNLVKRLFDLIKGTDLFTQE
jgi:hypothetical protein